MGGDVRLPLVLDPAALPVRKATLQDQVAAVEGHVEHFAFGEFDRSVGLMSKGPERSEAPLQSRETPTALGLGRHPTVPESVDPLGQSPEVDKDVPDLQIVHRVELRTVDEPIGGEHFADVTTEQVSFDL